ncbi:MAG: hypothetical protein AAGJ35_14070, partial [Myxococcota bacterium]
LGLYVLGGCVDHQQRVELFSRDMRSDVEIRNPKKVRLALKVLAFSPGHIAVPKATVRVDGKVVGKTDEYGVFIGSLPLQRKQKALYVEVQDARKRTFATNVIRHLRCKDKKNKKGCVLKRLVFEAYLSEKR